MEDRYLVLRTKAGDTEALRGIYDKYRDDLLILAIALLNDKLEPKMFCTMYSSASSGI
ncbi:MAG: hypothetical protein ACYTBV_20440 [Planctomycetota bacterium]